MPTYDYRCTACPHTWEEVQRITAPPTVVCPTCGEPHAERVISPGAGILFKGSGFYITDYRSDSYKKAAKAENGSNGSGSHPNESSGSASKEAGKTTSTGDSAGKSSSPAAE